MRAITHNRTAAETATTAEPGLPEGWTLAAFPEICELNPPKPASDSLPPDAPVTFVPMPAVDADQGAITNPQVKPYSTVRKGYTSFREGDVIFAKITPCMENGKAAIVRRLENGLGFGSTEFHVLRPTAAIIAEYVYYFIRQESFRRNAESEMTGSVGQKRVPSGFLEKSDIPLPPLPEQKRIVAKVEDLFTQVKAARDRLARVRKILKRFRQSVLAAACSGDLLGANSADSQLGTLGQGIGEMKNGLTRRPEGKEEGPIVLRLADVSEGVISLANPRRGRLSDSEIETYKLKNGDLLFLRVNGSLDLVGRCVQFNGAQEVVCFNDHLIRVRLDSSILTPAYVAIMANSPVGRGFITGKAVTTAGQHTVNHPMLSEMPVPMRSTADQQEIVRRVKGLFKLADMTEKRVEVVMRRAEKLTQAILAKAFRGELVPVEAELARREGRTHEAASVLLERLKAERERAAQPSSANSRRKPTAGRR